MQVPGIEARQICQMCVTIKVRLARIVVACVLALRSFGLGDKRVCDESIYNLQGCVDWNIVEYNRFCKHDEARHK